MDEYGIEENIIFTGMLSEEEMIGKYLGANCFLCASSIENSPNSLCEAMILGTPAVSSLVGGVGNLMEHGRSGFYYPADEPYMAAYYIQEIFEVTGFAFFL